MSEDVTAFLERVYKLNEDEALDLIYGTVDDWMREGKADEATEALRLADVTRLSISGSLAFISITRSQGNFLSALDGVRYREVGGRRAFYDRALAHAVTLKGEDYAKRCFEGLEPEKDAEAEAYMKQLGVRFPDSPEKKA